MCASTQLLNDTTLSYSRLRLTDGTNILGEATARAATGGVGQSVSICGILPITSLSAVSLNLQINASGNTTQLGAYDNGIAAIDWSLNAIDQQVPAPVLIGSVSSGSVAAERLERAYITNAGSCAISSQSGSWIASVTRPAVGRCTITLTSGMFSSGPACTMVPITTSGVSHRIRTANTTSTIEANTTDITGAGLDTDFYIMCMGPR